MDKMLYGEIKQNLLVVQVNIENAIKHSGREPGAVKLITVTKKKSVAHVLAGYACGLRDFGENYAELGQEKIEVLGDYADICWHLIGHIQSRKARLVAESYDFVHSIDSIKIAEKLNGYCREMDRKLPVLFEVNISGEMSKYGFPAQKENEWPRLAEVFAGFAKLAHLQACGLMTMPPFSDNPVESRPYFRQMRKLREYMQRQLPNMQWDELSMGTSLDYAVAVEEGATMLRIGEAILGKRTN